MIYMHTAIAFTLVSYLAKSQEYVVFLDAPCPVIGIAFCIMIVRVKFSTIQDKSLKTSTTDSIGWPHISFLRSSCATRESDGVVEENNGNLYSLQARSMQIAVKIKPDVKADSHSNCITEESYRDVSLDKNIPNLGP